MTVKFMEHVDPQGFEEFVRQIFEGLREDRSWSAAKSQERSDARQVVRAALVKLEQRGWALAPAKNLATKSPARQ